MPEPMEYEYTVLLVTPYYGDSRENAEQILEAALDWLNANRYKPGFRFHPTVSATLDVVSTVEQAAERLEDDDSLAMIIFHDASEDEQLDLLRECERRNVGACVTIPSPDLDDEEDDKPHEWKLVARSRTSDEPRPHRVEERYLSGPIEEDSPRTARRIEYMIAVMALGVMGYHWKKNPPKLPWLTAEGES